MDTTKASINRKLYKSYLKKGLQHHQVIEKIPQPYREQFIEDINKTYAEIIFGTSNFWFMLIVTLLIISFFASLIAVSGAVNNL